MGSNRRYEESIDARSRARNHDARIACTLPMDAYGPNPLEWVKRGKPAVWAWISWAEGPASRVAGFASGWNDRVVVVEWNEVPGGTRNTVVWRTAVTKRTA